MATNRELEAELRAVRELLERYGITADTKEPEKPEDRPDYIKHGSLEHARLIGLSLIDDPEQADGRTIYTSRTTGQMYCLEDEIGVLQSMTAQLVEEVQ